MGPEPRGGSQVHSGDVGLGPQDKPLAVYPSVTPTQGRALVPGWASPAAAGIGIKDTVGSFAFEELLEFVSPSRPSMVF